MVSVANVKLHFEVRVMSELEKKLCDWHDCIETATHYEDKSKYCNYHWELMR